MIDLWLIYLFAFVGFCFWIYCLHALFKTVRAWFSRINYTYNHLGKLDNEIRAFWKSHSDHCEFHCRIIKRIEVLEKKCAKK